MKYLSLFIVLLFFTCHPNNNDREAIPEIDKEKNAELIQPVEVDIPIKEPEKPKKPIASPSLPKEPITISHSTTSTYPWIDDFDLESSIINRFALPQGFERISYENYGFADWLRHIPLKEKGSVVKYYNGGIKPNKVHEAVLDIDIGKRDLQQCADAVMRLKAEYHYSKKDYQNIHFNYTSGHKVSFNDWRKGKKPIVKGNSVSFSSPSGNTDNSYSNFKKYMNQIFNFAGTASLEKELKQVDVKDIRPGDVFIQGGFPGHAVIVVDVAANDAGEKIFMIAQSYMPAQSIHILKNLNQRGMSPWYSTDFGENLNTPEWAFNRNNLRRFTGN